MSNDADENRYCLECGKPLEGKQQKYCGKKCDSAARRKTTRQKLDQSDFDIVVKKTFAKRTEVDQALADRSHQLDQALDQLAEAKTIARTQADMLRTAIRELIFATELCRHKGIRVPDDHATVWLSLIDAYRKDITTQLPGQATPPASRPPDPGENVTTP